MPSMKFEFISWNSSCILDWKYYEDWFILLFREVILPLYAQQVDNVHLVFLNSSNQIVALPWGLDSSFVKAGRKFCLCLSSVESTTFMFLALNILCYIYSPQTIWGDWCVNDDGELDNGVFSFFWSNWEIMKCLSRRNNFKNQLM